MLATESDEDVEDMDAMEEEDIFFEEEEEEKGEEEEGRGDGEEASLRERITPGVHPSRPLYSTYIIDIDV